MKGVQIAAFSDTNEKLPVNQEGEICILSDNTFVKYINNEEATSEVKQLHNDGNFWVHTGDLGYIDEDGFIYITGRSKRLIKRAAFKIALITIEKVLLTIPFVNDCVVVGAPDAKELEVPMAFVELKEEYSTEFDKIKEMIKEKFGKNLGMSCRIMKCLNTY